MRIGFRVALAIVEAVTVGAVAAAAVLVYRLRRIAEDEHRGQLYRSAGMRAFMQTTLGKGQ